MCLCTPPTVLVLSDLLLVLARKCENIPAPDLVFYQYTLVLLARMHSQAYMHQYAFYVLKRAAVMRCKSMVCADNQSQRSSVCTVFCRFLHIHAQAQSSLPPALALCIKCLLPAVVAVECYIRMISRGTK